jgi:hypothetical protein
LLVANLDHRPDERERLCTDQHLSRLSGLLQTRRNVHRVAGREPLLGAGQHLAGVDADPALDAQLRHRVAHLDRGPARTERVVLVRHRHAEDRHHRVADELLHRAAVRLDDPLHPLEVARQHRLQRLRIHRLPERGRANDVAEKHGHHLAVRADRHEPRLEQGPHRINAWQRRSRSTSTTWAASG